MTEYKMVCELNDEEIRELKEIYFTESLYETVGREPTINELANIDRYVSEEMIFEFYSGTIFTEDDFFCNQH